MSLKSFVKAHTPKSLLPLIKLPYRAIMWPVRRIKRHVIMKRIMKRATQYLPYYQDELSREILHDNARFLATGDNSILINTAINHGWRYTRLAAFPLVKHWEGKFSPDNYSGFVILLHDDMNTVEYTKKLLQIMGISDKSRLLSMKDFLHGAHVDKSELIIASVKHRNFPRIKAYAERKNLPNDIAAFIIGKHEEIQYLDVFEPINDEVIIDAGCFDGMTAIRFLKWGGSKIKRIYSFELDPANFSVCEENLKPYADRVTLVKKGTWDKDEVMYLNADSTGTSSSRASDNGTVKAFMTPIDSIVQDEHVTLIKMDVEGAELKSLMGERNTIIKNHPRLAICAYHKPTDLYELPGYILSLVPEYKFLLRRYDSHSGETVLYAYCD